MRDNNLGIVEVEVVIAGNYLAEENLSTALNEAAKSANVNKIIAKFVSSKLDDNKKRIILAVGEIEAQYGEKSLDEILQSKEKQGTAESLKNLQIEIFAGSEFQIQSGLEVKKTLESPKKVEARAIFTAPIAEEQEAEFNSILNTFETPSARVNSDIDIPQNLANRLEREESFKSNHNALNNMEQVASEERQRKTLETFGIKQDVAETQQSGKISTNIATTEELQNMLSEFQQLAKDSTLRAAGSQEPQVENDMKSEALVQPVTPSSLIDSQNQLSAQQSVMNKASESNETQQLDEINTNISTTEELQNMLNVSQQAKGSPPEAQEKPSIWNKIKNFLKKDIPSKNEIEDEFKKALRRQEESEISKNTQENLEPNQVKSKFEQQPQKQSPDLKSAQKKLDISNPIKVKVENLLKMEATGDLLSASEKERKQPITIGKHREAIVQERIEKAAALNSGQGSSIER